MFHVKHASGSRSTRPYSGNGSDASTWSRQRRCPRSGPVTFWIRRSSPPCSPTIPWATQSMLAAAPASPAWCSRSSIPVAGSPWSRPTASAAPSCARWRRPPAHEVSVVEGRFEAPDVQAALSPAGTIVARACAPLVDLLGLVFPVLDSHTYCIFPKGRRYRSELEEARRRWDFGADIVPSQTAAEARILRISDVERRRRS